MRMPFPHAVPQADPEKAATLVEGGALLIDVRETDEWAQARIPGAELRPLSQVNDWWRELPRDRDIVLYCRTGVRSANLITALSDQAGFDNVINLGGGIVAWYDAGLPIDYGKP